ncbi:PAAR domain-containing protein [Pseudomonas sp. TH43]|nr:PAAR domain-containing protein [Pseudomonas sp. TH43]
MAGKPVARLGDPGSHDENITTGSSPIFVNSMPVALVGDIYSCPIHGSNPITTGAPHVFGLGKDSNRRPLYVKRRGPYLRSRCFARCCG